MILFLLMFACAAIMALIAFVAFLLPHPEPGDEED